MKLKEIESKIRGKSLPQSHHVSNGILWLCSSKEWTDCNSLQKFWNKDNLNVANGEPEQFIPQIPTMNKLWDGKPVRREVFPLLIVCNLRNYGEHNIRQQNIFTSKYDEIIEALFMSLFLCIDI